MEIFIAEHAGYCYGVKRAVDTAIKNLEKNSAKNIYSLGPLIHNDQAVEVLKEKGLKVINKISDIESGVVIIRSHGVGKSIYDYAEENSISLVDATCPFVKKIQKIVYKMHKSGNNIIIIGDKDHPEIIGINGWCNNSAIIGKSISDFEEISFNKEKYVVVVQTTMNLKIYEEIKKYLENKIEDVDFNNTICLATQKRQSASIELSKKVDAMIVVGGKHSSNTKKLADICMVNCDTYLIETVDDLEIEKISAYNSVGIAAGASTPDFIINEVIKKLSDI